MINKIRYFFSILTSLISPPRCRFCNDTLLDEESFVCFDCQIKLQNERTYFETIAHNKISNLFWGILPIHNACCFFYFEKQGIIQHLIHSLKYKYQPEIGIFLGEIMGKELAASPLYQNIDYIIPVPIHDKRRKERSYNQTEKIAIGIQKHIQKPIIKNNLIRTIYRESQTTLTNRQRWKNARGIYKLLRPEQLKNKHILLVDDVITTGATITSCGKELCKANNIKISIVSIAGGM